MDAALNNRALLHSLTTLMVTKSADQTDAESAYWIAFKEGSRPALNFIFERYATLLYSYGASITKDSALVADCIQDIFFELWNKRESVAGDVKFIKFYLIKSLRRKIVRRLYTDKR
jgi:DNA-directed RNA polymerase specialized sigma24 family protein